MASFTALVADVMALTNRPDLVAETALAVKAATLQLHRSDFYYKDLFEVALKFDSVNYLQSINYRDLFPNYRALKYIRKYDPNTNNYETNGVGDFIRILTPEQVLDSYQGARVDMGYVAGDVIQIRSSTAIEYCLIGVYLNPQVATPETYKSWISDEAYYAIVYAAVAQIQGTVLNNSAKKNAALEQMNIHFLEVKNSNIIAEGY